MCVKNRVAALIFRVALLIGCAYGLIVISGVFEGRFVIRMLAYYTNISNIICLAFIFLSALHTAIRLKIGGIKGTSTFLPRFKGAVVMMLSATFLVYHFILVPQLFRMSVNYQVHSLPDILIHYFTPIMAVLDWLIFDEKGKYRWFEPLLWTLIPLLYFVAILIRAEIAPPLNSIGVRYPYFFIDVDAIGWTETLKNALICAVAFTAFGYLFLLIDKIPALRSKNQNIEY